MRRCSRTLSLLALLGVVLSASGCITSDRVLYDQARDYQETLVKGILMPKWAATNPDPNELAAVQSAIESHDSFLDNYEQLITHRANAIGATQ